MAQNRPHRAETFSHAFYTSRQVDYQGRAPYSASGSRQCGSRSALCSFEAHQLRNARNNFFDDGQSGFGCDIAWGESGTTGGDDDLKSFRAGASEARFDRGTIVRKNLNGLNFKAGVCQDAPSFGTGKVVTFSGRSGITDG